MNLGKTPEFGEGKRVALLKKDARTFSAIFRSSLFALTLSFLLLLSACFQPRDVAKVIQVIDGDTIIIEEGYHIRYIGIDTPERGEPYYHEAWEANRKLVEGKKVRLGKDLTDKDKHGRLLRYVYVDTTFVNAELVRQGYAYAKAYLPNTKYQVYLEAVEREAKQKGKGIWEQK